MCPTLDERRDKGDGQTHSGMQLRIYKAREEFMKVLSFETL